MRVEHFLRSIPDFYTRCRTLLSPHGPGGKQEKIQIYPRGASALGETTNESPWKTKTAKPVATPLYVGYICYISSASHQPLKSKPPYHKETCLKTLLFIMQKYAYKTALVFLTSMSKKDSHYSFSSNSGNWWWTGRPGVLQSMGSQRVRYNWVTELNWTI